MQPNNPPFNERTVIVVVYNKSQVTKNKEADAGAETKQSKTKKKKYKHKRKPEMFVTDL